MGKIKVCHIVNIITGKSDGVYAHLKMLFASLDAERYQHVLVFQGNPVIEDEVRKIGVTVIPLPSLKKKFSLSSFIDVYNILKKNEITVIHAHLLKPYIIAGIVNIFLRKKAVFNYHGSFIQNKEYYSFFEETVYRIAHTLVYLSKSYQRAAVPSHASKRALLSETRLLPPIDVYYNGMSLGEKNPANTEIVRRIEGAAKGKYRIGIISRLDPEKRIDIAVETAKEILLRRNDLHFSIVGNGALEDEIQQQIDRLHCSDQITCFGFVPNAQAYISLFDLILLTSDREGMPFILWETMAAGVPIVASDVGGIKEIVEQEGCGKVYERGNILRAAEILNDLLNDRQLRKQMGERGINAIRTKYNEKEFAKRFDEIYSGMMISL